jgi:hypothetical protein
MITEETMRDVLRERAERAPDPVAVRAAIRGRLHVRSRSRVRGRRVALVATAACAAAVVAVPVALLHPHAGDRPVTGHSGQTVAAAQPITLEPLAIPFTVPLLPDGWVGPGESHTAAGYADRRFTAPGGNGWLLVRLWDQAVLDHAGTSPPAPAHPQVARHLGGSLWLGVDGSPAPDMLRRIAARVDVQHPDRLRFPFQITHLPPGVTPIAADIFIVRYEHGSDPADQPARPVRDDPPVLIGVLAFGSRPGTPRERAWLTISFTTGGLNPAEYGKPNDTVLGHPARYDARDTAGVARLQVRLLPRLAITVEVNPAGHAGVDRAELVGIVTGLRLVQHPTTYADWTPPLD